MGASIRASTPNPMRRRAAPTTPSQPIPDPAPVNASCPDDAVTAALVVALEPPEPPEAPVLPELPLPDPEPEVVDVLEAKVVVVVAVIGVAPDPAMAMIGARGAAVGADVTIPDGVTESLG